MPATTVAAWLSIASALALVATLLAPVLVPVRRTE
jgi:hypothetical protein